MRIVSLAPSNTEIMYELGAEDEIVATTALCDYPEEAVEKPSVGGWTDIDADRVEEFDPDVALASDDLQDDIVEGLEKRGIEVLQVKPHTVEEVYQSILTIGKLVGRKDRAEEIIDDMKEEIGSIDLEGARVYCEEWTDPPMVSGNWIPGLVEKAGGEYFIREGERSREFELEELKEFDPEYIFLNVCGAGENIDPEQILKREEWRSITAVKEGNVFVVDDALLNRPGPRIVEGLKKMANAIKHFH